MKLDEHAIREIRSPATVTLRCSCGWSWSATRAQNALARAAKLRAAAQRHAVEAETPTTSTLGKAKM